ncbi:hypothetical protein [Nocardioides speluncae]|uniref:hypothetical protein n=1 Tax=Nocardioides speluncae TaxID=2670337 RepID=UPI001980A4E8|nr:hypothetical protein [Nocardioides speluncae]
MGYKAGFTLATVAAVLAWASGALATCALPIPPGPGVLLVPHFVGAAAEPRPVDSYDVPQHPHLSANGTSNMHNDPYATKAYAGPGPLGRDPEVRTASYGISECATVTFDRAGRLVALCGDPVGPELKVIDPDTLDQLASHRLPARQFRPGSSPLSDLCGGAYFYLDQADRAVVATTDRHIRVVAEQPGPELVPTRSYDLTDVVPEDDCLIALMPDWAGRIWFVTSAGIVGNVDPDSGTARTTTLPGEGIVNSLSTDDTGGVYVVSDHALYRFDADGPSGAPAISWRQPYDRGSRQKPGQLSQGSGTTPTLIGTDLVAITDNADPRMNVRVFERGRSSGGRPVCQAAVFDAGTSATENSMVAVGNALFVENNYGYAGPQSTLLGKTTAPGIARVDVADGECRVAWTNRSSAPTSVPKASAASGLLYAYTKPAHHAGVDAWYLTAIDLRTGRTAFSRLAGTGLLFNNHYAAIYLDPAGSAYVATLGGLVRVRDGN